MKYKPSHNSRRNFLKQAMLTSAVVVSGPAAFSNIIVPRKQRTIRVALVGLGYYSTDLLAPALQQTRHCKLSGIVTGTPSKIPRWQSRYNIPDKNVYNYENIEEIANNDDIDVLYIVLPTGLHSRDAVKAANAGKHVWCEKPMARTVTQCQDIINACRGNKRKLSIGYRMQHEQNTRQIMEFSQSKPFGSIKKVTAKAGYYDGRSDHWKQNKALGGGALYDMGVYPINAIRYSTGMEPIAVTGKHSTNRPEIYHEVDETTHFTMEFKGGLIAEGATSLGDGMNHLRIDCEDGWYELKPFQSYSGVRGQASDGRTFQPSPLNQQAKQMDDDALAIINNTEVMVPGENGRQDIFLVEKIYEAAKTNSRVTL